MSDLDPMAQAHVESEIRSLSNRLTQVTEEVAAAAVEAAVADAAYDLAKAHALLGQVGRGGTVPEKQARALVLVEHQFTKAKTTEAVAKSLYEAGRNIRAQLDALRSINANVRDHVMHGATGRGA
jgi:hypothetical protein